MKFKKFIKEAMEDTSDRCPECNNLLNDEGTCPYCDHGETELAESLTTDKINSEYHVEQFAENWYGVSDSKGGFYKENNKPLFFESVQRAEEYAQKLNASIDSDSTSELVETTEVIEEELSNKEKLLRAYPELNFDTPVVEELLNETISIRDKLKAAYPELNFDNSVVENVIPEEDNFTDYDDDYDVEDDIDADYAHSALYGGDLTYCKHCGTRLVRNEWGGYCPECDEESELDDSFN